MKTTSKKKSIKSLLLIGTIGLIITSLSGCKIADLRTSEIKEGKQSEAQVQFAKNLLIETVKKHGFDKVNQFSTYEVIVNDHWKGLLGKAGNSWDWKKDDDFALRFSVDDFDGQIEVLEGDKEGFVAGIQSWDYYEKIGDKYETNVEDDDGKIFNLAAIHYFFELSNRLSSKATFIRYAGEDEIRGTKVDKIFVSWKNESTEDYDHYVLWISKKTGLIDAVQFTTREAPAPQFLSATMQFEDYKNIDGIFIPFKQSVQMGKPNDKTSKYIHQINIKKFEWDAFPISDIRPFSGIESVGDDKPYQN